MPFPQTACPSLHPTGQHRIPSRLRRVVHLKHRFWVQEGSTGAIRFHHVHGGYPAEACGALLRVGRGPSGALGSLRARQDRGNGMSLRIHTVRGCPLRSWVSRKSRADRATTGRRPSLATTLESGGCRHSPRDARSGTRPSSEAVSADHGSDDAPAQSRSRSLRHGMDSSTCRDR